MLLPSGFLLINKPIDWTSFDVVGFVRKKVRQTAVIPTEAEESLRSSHGDRRDFSTTLRSARNDRPKLKNIKVGHAGTLDPFATGLLIVGVGREATKRLDAFKNLAKTYVATVHLGATSDTDDCTGAITISPPFQGGALAGASVEGGLPSEHGTENTGRRQTATSPGLEADLSLERRGGQPPTFETVKHVLKTFEGKQLQTPPMYSAKQVNGVRLYKLARQGKTIERTPDEIEIYDIALLQYTWPLATIEVTCSAGTYIRTIAHDLGEKLGVGGFCETLERTKIGPYTLAEAQSLENLDLSTVSLAFVTAQE